MVGYRTLFGCLIFIVLWSSGWIGSKYGQEFAGTFTLLAYRYVIVVLVLSLWVSLSRSWRPIPRSQLLLHVCVGVLSHAIYLGAGNSALLLGVSAGLVAFITALQPMITAILSPAIAGERVSFRQWSGLALGFTAIMLVVSDRIALGGSAYAYSLPFVAILAISVASLIDRRVSLDNRKDNLEPTPLSLIALIHSSGALIVMLVAAGMLEGFEAQWGGELIFSILWLAVIVSLGAYGMMFFMLRRMSAIKVASLGYLAPPTTMLIAYVVFAERLSTVDVLGLVLAGIAVWLVMSKEGNIFSKVDSKRLRDVTPASLTIEPQGLMSNSYNPTLASNGVTLDIDLGEPAPPVFEFPGGCPQATFKDSIANEEAAARLEELIYFRKHQIHRLGQVVFNLRDSQNKIEALRYQAPIVEPVSYDSVLDEIELKRACDGLSDLLGQDQNQSQNRNQKHDAAGYDTRGLEFLPK